MEKERKLTKKRRKAKSTCNEPRVAGFVLAPRHHRPVTSFAGTRQAPAYNPNWINAVTDVAYLRGTHQLIDRSCARFAFRNDLDLP